MIETERLSLRLLAEEDLPVWSAFLADPQATRLLHTPEPVTDPERAAAGLTRWISLHEGLIGMYTVVVRESGETAGFVGFVRRELEWGPELELGWLLLPRAHGNGYATEAATALLPLAGGRVISLIRVENEASARVARKLGMECERVIEYYGFQTGVWASAGVPPTGFEPVRRP